MSFKFISCIPCYSPVCFEYYWIKDCYIQLLLTEPKRIKYGLISVMPPLPPPRTPEFAGVFGLDASARRPPLTACEPEALTELVPEPEPATGV